MLSCTGLDFFYGKARRLKNISFTAESPSLFALFGHNGSGKSTLLKMLCGLLPVQTGAVCFFGENAIGSDGYVDLKQRKLLGVLFQGKSSDEKLTAFDNLLYAGALMGLSRKKAIEQAKLALSQAHLEERALSPVKKFSYGMQRRLELYRCFLHEPRIVLLDEPTAGLDVLETAQFFSFLKRYQEKHQAVVVMSSHQPDELLHADNILMLKEGEILAQGAPDAMVKKLDYWRCSFSVKGEEVGAVSNDLRLFDQNVDEKASITHAKIHVNDVDALLLGPLLKMDLFREFSIKKPSLADVYEDLLKKHEREYGQA